MYTKPKGPQSIHGWSTTARARSRGVFGARLVYWAALVSVLFAVSQCAHAELVTEIGGGIKFGGATILKSNCAWAIPFDKDMRPLSDNDGRAFVTVPCGGRNPVFVGWPLAWDFPNGMRVGWFHQSNWLDGPPFNHNAETHFNCLCVSKTIRWTK